MQEVQVQEVQVQGQEVQAVLWGHVVRLCHQVQRLLYLCPTIVCRHVLVVEVACKEVRMQDHTMYVLLA